MCEKVCEGVCVCEKYDNVLWGKTRSERERERERQTDRDTERDRDREREREKKEKIESMNAYL